MALLSWLRAVIVCEAILVLLSTRGVSAQSVEAECAKLTGGRELFGAWEFAILPQQGKTPTVSRFCWHRPDHVHFVLVRGCGGGAGGDLGVGGGAGTVSTQLLGPLNADVYLIEIGMAGKGVARPQDRSEPTGGGTTIFQGADISAAFRGGIPHWKFPDRPASQLAPDGQPLGRLYETAGQGGLGPGGSWKGKVGGICAGGGGVGGVGNVGGDGGPGHLVIVPLGNLGDILDRLDAKADRPSWPEKPQ